MIEVRETPAGATFRVKVRPRARKNALTGTLAGAGKLSLTAPPADGKANAACIDFLAKLLRVPRGSVTIASGHGIRNKIIRVTGVTAVVVCERLTNGLSAGQA
jgi:uncharacterized protein